MIRCPRHRLPRLAALVLVATLAPAAACGKKGPPLPPLQLVPARIDDLVVRRLGADIYLQFTVPSRNANGSTPADVREVAVYGLTGVPLDAGGRPLDERAFRRAATIVARVEVRPPPKDTEETPAEAAPPDPRPAQGARAAATEPIAPALEVPWQPPPSKEPPAAGGVPSPDVFESTPLAPPLVSPSVQPLMRYYAVAGENHSGRSGPLSPQVGVSLTEPPATPPALRVTYDAAKYVLEWQEPEGVRRAPEAPSGEGMLTGRPVFTGLPTHTYNVYESQPPASAGATVPSPLNASPLPAPRLELAGVQFGVERCFAVRTVEASGRSTVESAASPPTCVTARDTFAPSAPRNLAAVGAEGAVSLIWEASPEADLAGYVVLRGEAGGAVMQAVTPTPIRETTYRDTSVRAGMRYAYSVVAVDSATPPNVSAPSNRVEEIAR